MSIYSKTLADVVESVCRTLEDWYEGTATAAGTTTTLVDTINRVEEDDFFNNLGSWLYLRSGTYAGSYRKISDFVKSTGTISFSPALAGAPGTGATYSIHTEWDRPNVVDKINLAIDMIAEEANVWKTDEDAITLVAGQYEYEIPTSFMYIHKLTMADADGYFYDTPIPPDQYVIVHGTTPKLKLLGFANAAHGHLYSPLWRADGGSQDFTADRALRIEGFGSPDILSSDSDTCPVSPAYLTFQAAALLHGQKMRRQENDPDQHATQAAYWQGLANTERERVVGMRMPPNIKRIRE